MLDAGHWLLVTGYWILDAGGAKPGFAGELEAGA